MLLNTLLHPSQVAVTFADLHDTPVRMQEKGVIQGVVPWSQSRKILYWRLRRLLAEDSVKKEIRKVQQDSSDGQIDAMLRRWFFEDKGSVEVSGSCCGRFCCLSQPIIAQMFIVMPSCIGHAASQNSYLSFNKFRRV